MVFSYIVGGLSVHVEDAFDALETRNVSLGYTCRGIGAELII